MTWTNVPAGIINAAQLRFWNTLGMDARMVADRMNDDPSFLEEIVLLAKLCGFKPSGNQKRAQEIMGPNNFFGIENAIKHFGHGANFDRLAAQADVPWSEKVLKSVRDTHILVMVFSTSVWQIKHHPKNKAYFPEQIRNVDGQVISGRPHHHKAVWHLIRKTVVDNSASKIWSKQQLLLKKTEEVPSIDVLAYTIISYHQATGEHLFCNVRLRCSDTDSRDDRVRLISSHRGFYIDTDTDDDPDNDLCCIVSELKPSL